MYNIYELRNKFCFFTKCVLMYSFVCEEWRVLTETMLSPFQLSMQLSGMRSEGDFGDRYPSC